MPLSQTKYSKTFLKYEIFTRHKHTSETINARRCVYLLRFALFSLYLRGGHSISFFKQRNKIRIIPKSAAFAGFHDRIAIIQSFDGMCQTSPKCRSSVLTLTCAASAISYRQRQDYLSIFRFFQNASHGRSNPTNAPACYILGRIPYGGNAGH